MIGIPLDTPAQAVLEPFHSVGDLTLEARQLSGILIDAVIVETSKPFQYLIELARIDPLALKCPAELLDLAGILAHLTAELADVTRCKQAVAVATVTGAVRRPTSCIRAVGVAVAVAPAVGRGAVVPASITTLLTALRLLATLALLTALALLTTLALLTALTLLALLTGLPLLAGLALLTRLSLLAGLALLA